MCCQNENMWWTKEIAKTQKYFRYVIIGIVTFLSIYLLRNETVVGVLMKFLPIAPLLIELIVEVLRANRQMKIFSEYEGKREIINYSTEIRECDLRNLQKSIDERRLIPIITINKIHDVLSTKFHERYSRITR